MIYHLCLCNKDDFAEDTYNLHSLNNMREFSFKVGRQIPVPVFTGGIYRSGKYSSSGNTG